MFHDRFRAVSRELAERCVPRIDCSGRPYDEDEWEDLVRYVIEGAETQWDLLIYGPVSSSDEEGC